MDKERKWTSWLLIAGIVVVVGTALAVTTLASTQPQTDESMPSPTAQDALPGILPSASPMPNTGSHGSRTANASAIGYAGPVLVRLTLDEQGSIAELDVGGVRFQETEGVGSRVKETGFVDTFIGKTPPLALGEDVDGIAGATMSSQAMVDAVNDAAAFLHETPSDRK